MKNIFKHLSLIFPCLLITQLVFASENNITTLKGKLQDENGMAVSFANVAILAASDSSFVSGTVTDLEGNFNIQLNKEGKFMLRLSAISFEYSFTEPFMTSGQEMNFGVITLKEETKILSEVEIKALRPAVIYKADKMVVSVEGTALAAGSTAMEVLEKSPGVWVDQEGNVHLNGKKGVGIMIDGRLSYLSAKEVQDWLNSMSAENIQDIELIANPSSKFDAEGSSGLINIRLKHNNMTGMNGSVHSSYTYNSRHAYSVGANLKYKKGKWNSFLSAELNQSPFRRTTNMIREFHSNGQEEYFNQVGEENINAIGPSLRVGTDFQINRRHSIGTTINFSSHHDTGAYDTETKLENLTEQKNVLVKAHNGMSTDTQNAGINLRYTGQLDTAGTRLSANIDYVKLADQNFSTFENHYKNLDTQQQTEETLNAENPSDFDIYSARVDFTKKVFDNNTLELGIKTSKVVSDNGVDFYRHQGEQMILDEDKSSAFLYQENIYAAYVNYNSQLTKKLNVQFGLRLEHTTGKGNELSRGSYTDLFPSVSVQQTISENYQLSYNYSRRINRPEYWALNPFIWYLDPYTSILGNPELKPEYINSLQFTQSFFNTYNLTLSYSLSKDMISEVPRQKSGSDTEFGPDNLDKGQNFSATVMAPLQISKRWEVSNDLTGAYQKNEMLLEGHNHVNESFYLIAQQTHHILVAKNFHLQVSGRYMSPSSSYGVYYFEGYWNIDAGLTKSLLNDQLDLSLNATDIFRSQKSYGNANIGENINIFNQYFYEQSIRFSLRFKFNKGKQIEANDREADFEELNRAGGS
jgi:hypothetical protein